MSSFLYDAFLDWRVPLTVSGVYVCTVALWNKVNRGRISASPSKSSSSQKPVKKEFSFFDTLVLVHNLILMVYSFISFISTLPIMVDGFMNLPLGEAFCDQKALLWSRGMQFWTFVFYLSKYYELIDTLIILLKGRPSSFLQTFHHTGAIMAMFLLCKYETKGAFVFVVFNSFIHTIMYCYYSLTCLGYRPKWKQILTQMQISQFLIGNPLALVYCLYPGCLHPDPQMAQGQFYSLLFNFVYVGCLVFLFNNFAERTYKKETNKKD